jgi:hypothetical protein
MYQYTDITALTLEILVARDCGCDRINSINEYVRYLDSVNLYVSVYVVMFLRYVMLFLGM